MVSNCTVIAHEAFEDANTVSKFLSDGVHFSLLGLNVYTEEIKKCLGNLV
jgi:hypothetical protein